MSDTVPHFILSGSFTEYRRFLYDRGLFPKESGVFRHPYTLDHLRGIREATYSIVGTFWQSPSANENNGNRTC